jgi:hypothetical protein
VISGVNGQIVAPPPGTLKMHMTGMENFNVGSKRGGPGAIPINTNVSPGLVIGNGDMSQHPGMQGTNKSNMCKSI